MSEPVTDQTIEAAQRGDELAFASIYHEYGKKVYNTCLRIVKNPEEAEDMGQEVFLHLFRFLRSYRRECKFSTWLYRVCVTVVYCKLRKKRIPTVSLACSPDYDVRTKVVELACSDQSLLLTVERIAIERAVSKLPKGARTVFELHDRLGFEHKDIALKLGITSGTTKSQLTKARRRLRQYLSGHLSGPFPKASHAQKTPYITCPPNWICSAVNFQRL